MMFLLINTGYKQNELGVLAVPKLVSVQSALSVSEIKNKFSKTELVLMILVIDNFNQNI